MTFTFDQLIDMATYNAEQACTHSPEYAVIYSNLAVAYSNIALAQEIHQQNERIEMELYRQELSVGGAFAG